MNRNDDEPVELTELLDSSGRPVWLGEFGPAGGEVAQTVPAGPLRRWRYVDTVVDGDGELRHRYEPVP